MSREDPRIILATMHHKNKVVRSRGFARVDTAVPKVMKWLLLSGEPGDLVELSHREFGYQIGVIKISTKKISIKWTLER